jgi:integrase
VTHDNSAIERARHRDRDEPPQEGRGGGGRVERQVKDEARNALLVGSIDAREDGFLQLASELVWHASGTARARALLGKGARVCLSLPFFKANRTWNSGRFKLKMPSDVTPHVLRHSLASLAADLGHADSTIAGLIGHKQQSMTSRYLHLDKALVSAANIVAVETLRLMRS